MPDATHSTKGDAPIRIGRVGAIGEIVLDRPAKKNALDFATTRALRDAIEAFATDAEIRVIAIRSSSDDFCAGVDIEALELMLGAKSEVHRADASALGDVFLALREVPKPTVAIVTGRALGGGAGLATACDIVLARDDARFGYPEVRIGFVPALVMTMLRRCVGEKAAADLVLTGRLVAAHEARELGLVSRVLAAATFDADVARVLEGLSRTPETSLAKTKHLLYALDGRPFEHGITLGVSANVEVRGTPAFAEGVRRFVHRDDS